MTATINWKPSKKVAASLNVPAPSSFMKSMKAAGFDLSCTIDAKDLPVIRAMAAVFESSGPNPYQQIVDLLEKHDAIDLWATH